MPLSTKAKFFISVIALLTSAAIGRFSVQKPSVKETETIKTNTEQQKDKDTHTKTVVNTVKKPNGEVDTTQTTTTDIVSKTDTQQQSDMKLQETITPPKTNTLNISALIGNDFSKGLISPTYGASVTKQMLGPITIGGFGFTNGLLGLSIGLNF